MPSTKYYPRSRTTTIKPDNTIVIKEVFEDESVVEVEVDTEEKEKKEK